MQSIMNLIYLLICILRPTSISNAFSCCHRVILSLIVIYFSGIFSLPSFAKSTKLTYLETKHNSTQENYHPVNGLLAQKSNTTCQQTNITYQEVYSFETENFYISICQLGSNFYYYRQSKKDLENILVIPAQAAFGREVFQATSGKIIYFVGKDGDRYYSSVMLNNNEVVFEPELPPEPLVFSPEIIDRGVAFSFSQIGSIDSYNWRSARWKVDPSEKSANNDRSAICTRDKSTFSPYFDGWSNLLGKTTDVANNYATNNGHNFIYKANSQDQASIETKEGAIINLNIATPSKIIEQVCVTPTAIN